MMIALYTWMTTRLARDERGAAAVEYGLLVALIAVAIVGAVLILGQKLTSTFCYVVAELPFGPQTC